MVVPIFGVPIFGAEVDIFNSVRYLAPGGVMCLDDWNKPANSANVMYAGSVLAYHFGWHLNSLEHFQSPTLGKANVVWLINEPWARDHRLSTEQIEAVNRARENLEYHFNADNG